MNQAKRKLLHILSKSEQNKQEVKPVVKALTVELPKVEEVVAAEEIKVEMPQIAVEEPVVEEPKVEAEEVKSQLSKAKKSKKDVEAGQE